MAKQKVQELFVTEYQILADSLDEATKAKLPRGVLMQVQGKLQEAHRINRNRRGYHRFDHAVEAIRPAVENKETIGAGHHPEKGYGRLGDQALIPTGLWTNDRIVEFSADIPETDEGRNAAALLRAGYKLRVSTKGDATLVPRTMDESHPWWQWNQDLRGVRFDEVGEDFAFDQFQPFDFVIGASVTDAGVTRVVAEEVDVMAEDTKKELTDKLDAANKQITDLTTKIAESEKTATERADALRAEVEKRMTETAPAITDDQRKLLDAFAGKEKQVESLLRLAESLAPKPEPPKNVDEKDRRLMQSAAEIAALKQAHENLQGRVRAMEAEKKASEERVELDRYIAETVAKMPAELREAIASDLRDRASCKEDVDSLAGAAFARYKGAIKQYLDRLSVKDGDAATKGTVLVEGNAPDQIMQRFGGSPDAPRSTDLANDKTIQELCGRK